MKRKILVVGGSKGIGEAITKSLLSSDFIINISRSTPNFTHENLEHYSCDVLKDELPEIDSLDGLIYCPGSINLKPFNRLTEEDFKDDFNINVLGAIKVLQKYLAQLKNSDTASVILFSTVAVKMGMPFHASTAASKSAVEGLMKSLAAEFVANIRFNAIAPTVTNTQLASKLLRNEKSIENIKERHPMKDILQPDDVANMAAFLISDKASKITGQIYELDCGIVSLKI